VHALTQRLNKKSSVASVCQGPSRPRTAFCPTPPPWPLVHNFLALLLVLLLSARSCFISVFFQLFQSPRTTCSGPPALADRAAATLTANVSGGHLLRESPPRSLLHLFPVRSNMITATVPCKFIFSTCSSVPAHHTSQPDAGRPWDAHAARAIHLTHYPRRIPSVALAQRSLPLC
jgi:hypothetical protein